ncbi:nitroreductase family protein [Bacillus sp. PAMC26568]|nr:nitroreductase family protein [Bacillus sp. PAMC26568]
MLKKYTPQRIKELVYKARESKLYVLLTFLGDYLYDLLNFLKYSAVFNRTKSQEHFQGSLIYYYHKIEKGLALPTPRVGFGKEHVNYLTKLVENYSRKYEWDETSIIALNCLNSYYEFNKDNGLDLYHLYEKLNKLSSSVPPTKRIKTGGVLKISRDEVVNQTIDFKKFANSRYSIRNFSPEKVPLKSIEEAIEISQKTPSVCNRQASRVYVYQNDNIKNEILKYQNGNAGFGESASSILLVTSKLEYFTGPHERNQSYIDGGMYAMSLIYALHSMGIGTCPLNLALGSKISKKLKKAANIPESETLVMMIAVGNIPDKLKVAVSHRRKATDVMKVY